MRTNPFPWKSRSGEGYLFEFKFDNSREHFAFSDPKLKDRFDNNDYKFDQGQSDSLVAGKNFGIVTNIVTGRPREKHSAEKRAFSHVATARPRRIAEGTIRRETVNLNS
jgi:hypothetical protein